MKFSRLWLQELTNLNLTTTQLAEQLTMLGLEVASTSVVASNFHGVVVGQILEVSPHPNADKLTICTVCVGGEADTNLSIVCGASNVRSKLKVPVAVLGAELPGGFKIKKAKLRGMESNGMLCSAAEIGLPDQTSGLFELPDDAPVGADLRQYLALDDEIIEVELTANRGDCLSMLGIAREVAAINHTQVLLPAVPKFLENAADIFPISIEAKEVCPHYSCRIIRGVNNQVITPLWMQERLRRAGMQPVNFVVDATNYVMLELGQPLHAFDLAKLDGKIVVRYARTGESLELLSGNQVDLDDTHVVIADDSKCLALAGVMGGAESGVSFDTRDMLLESAFFSPGEISLKTRALKLATESAYRYERGVDYDLQLLALNRVTALIIKIAGGAPGAAVELLSKEQLKRAADIILPRDSVKELLGVEISDGEITDILSRLGIMLKPMSSGWQAKIPSWRFDIRVTEDLVEELARVYGYHLIPEQKIVAELGGANIASDKNDRDRLGFLLEDLGYSEVITYSFIDEKMQTLFGGEDRALPLANPISSEQSVMRTTLWPGLIGVVKHNINRQQSRVRLFESGMRFVLHDGKLEQTLAVAGVAYGDLYAKQWGIIKREPTDFFDLKRDVDAILRLFAKESDVVYLPRVHSALHPGRSAQILVCDVPVGWIGEIHPVIEQQLELSGKTSVFEINLSFLINKLQIKFKEFSIFPKIERDIAVIVDRSVSWQQIKQKMIDISGELLQNVTLFDVYCSENVGLDKRSIAIRLVFQSMDRTLVDAEVEEVLSRIVLVLHETFGASLRG